MAALLAAASGSSDGRDFPIGWIVFWIVFLTGSGLWLLIAPRKAWRILHSLSLMYKDPEGVEPSTFAMVYYRVSGVLAIAIAVFLAILWIRVRW